MSSGFGGGFSFGSGGQQTGTAQKSVSFALPTSTQGTTATTGGFGFGSGTSTSATAGFSLTAAKPATTSAPSLGGGFGFGNTTPAMGAPKTTATGIALGAPKPTTTGFALGAPTTTGFALGAPKAAATGFGFGVTNAAASTANTGLKLGATTSTAPTLGLGFGTSSAPALSTGPSLGLNLAAATATSALSSASAPSVKVGLGGLDPKTTSASTGAAAGDAKTSGTKSAKEEQIPAELVKDIENFKKFLKDQKEVREKIARVSSREISGIQEEVNNLRKMLAVVSNGVQRSAAAVDKLKTESAMELKNVEIAQRTKDTPPGLQYENVAPTVYFHRLVEEFEVRMTVYRQQIEEMESYLVALNQPGLFSPQELNQCLKKLHETFLGLAAQLHGVHEAVKAQKEQYLNYRKAIHGDTTNIFETRKKVAEKTKSSRSVASSIGPTPFAGLTNAAATALALSIQRPPQAQAQTQLLPSFGAATQNTGTLFGGKTTGTTFGFGAKPLGGTGLFGNTGGSTLTNTIGGTTGFAAFGQQKPATTGFGGSLNLSSAPATGTSSFTFGSTTQNQPFQLQSPPTGNKRGKRA